MILAMVWAFASARRTLQDHVASTAHLVDGERLGAVAVQNVQHLGRRNERVDVGVFGDHTLGAGKSFGQQAFHQWSVGDAAGRRPVVGVEIAVHQKLGEGEEAEHDVIAEHFPASLGRNCIGDLGEVGGGVEAVACLEGR